MWLYGSKNRTDFILGLWRKFVALGGPDTDVPLLLLNSLGLDPSLWLFWRRCSIYAFFVINSGSLKGHAYNFPSCCINNSLTSLLSSPHPKHFPFMYGDENFLDLWKDLDWYCWPVFVWTRWSWFGPFWWWKALTKFLLKMGSIMVEERDVVISTSAVYRVSKNSLIVNWNVVGSWCFYWLRSKFLYSS